MDLSVRRVYKKHGIAVVVDIDFENNRVSLMERTGSGEYRPKSWVFQDRSNDYMGGWIRIFKAMEYAVTEASKELAKALDKKEQEQLHNIVEILMHPKLKKGQK